MEGNHVVGVHHRKRDAGDHGDSQRDSHGVQLNLSLELVQFHDVLYVGQDHADAHGDIQADRQQVNTRALFQKNPGPNAIKAVAAPHAPFQRKIRIMFVRLRD
jgi:hypothetical protein